MEEILASIRRIIADDNPDAAKASAPVPASAPQPRPAAPAPAKPAMSQDDIDAMLADQASDEADVLELGDPVSPPRGPEPGPSFRQVPASDVVFREEPMRESAPPPVSYEQSSAPMERLLSAETNAAVSAAFGSLATTILSENSRTIEDLVREMLRPMLKAWLDDNLPGLVERMVRAEIERVSRGGR
jgi:cell pole-organizing protein PopZ